VNSAQAATIAAAAEPTAAGETPTVTTLETCGGDDISYQVPITATVTFDGVQYNSVYATTNSVITFGRPDGTYWDYPTTPSISLYSMDWVVYPDHHQDEHLIIRSSDGGFQVDISARPIWLWNAQNPTNIVITAAINTDGTVAMSYLVTGPTYDNQTRTGVRLTDGSIVTLAEYGVTQVQTAPVLTPEPVDTATSTSQSESQTSTVDTSTSTPSNTTTPPFIPQGATVIQEGSTASVTALPGKRVLTVSGYYGDPDDGSRGIDVSSTLTSMFAGRTSFTVTASNEFSDPAPGTVKVLIFLVTYEDVPQTTPSDTSTTTVDTSTVVDSSTGVVDSTTSQNTTSPSDATPSTGQEPQPVTPVPQEPVVVPRDPSTEENIVEEPAPTDPVLENPEDTQQEESENVLDENPTEETDTPVLPEPEPEDQLLVPSDNSTVEEAVSEAMADGILTEEEKEEVADALVEAADGEAISAEDIKDAGLTYDDLPPETPVDVRTDDKGNPVIIEAQVAAALVVLESPAALVGALFDDPGKALLAVASIGADMSAEEREESEKVVVASVIAGQAAIGAAAMATQTTTTTGGTSSGGSSGGGGASGEIKGVRRRNP
jgi:hypothetical protein